MIVLFGPLSDSTRANDYCLCYVMDTRITYDKEVVWYIISRMMLVVVEILVFSLHILNIMAMSLRWRQFCNQSPTLDLFRCLWLIDQTSLYYTEFDKFRLSYSGPILNKHIREMVQSEMSKPFRWQKPNCWIVYSEAVHRGTTGKQCSR